MNVVVSKSVAFKPVIKLISDRPGFLNTHKMITLTKRLKKEAESRSSSNSSNAIENTPRRISIRDKLLVKEVGKSSI